MRRTVASGEDHVAESAQKGAMRPMKSNSEGGLQLALMADDGLPLSESRNYLTRQLLTYIGNKRALLEDIGLAVERVKRRLGVDKLKVLDAFSGSGIVSRFLKAHASYLVSNDIEAYAEAVSKCYLRNHSSVDWSAVEEARAFLNGRVDADFPRGIIEELYAPECDDDIRLGERVFYTRANARRLDNYRRIMEQLEPDCRTLLTGPLLSAASVHANTAGVFKGFYKDRTTGVGRFGGTNADALSRICATIQLELPILSRFECDYEVVRRDANLLVRTHRGFDLAYLDPPYNQHPYGSNYFMLNLLVDYQKPLSISRVSGIPHDWQRSGYNVRSRSRLLMRDLVESTDAKFILISFNNEGFIDRPAMEESLRPLGRLEVVERQYNTYRGSRNLSGRSLHVTEQLFLLERS